MHIWLSVSIIKTWRPKKSNTDESSQKCTYHDASCRCLARAVLRTRWRKLAAGGGAGRELGLDAGGPGPRYLPARAITAPAAGPPPVTLEMPHQLALLLLLAAAAADADACTCGRGGRGGRVVGGGPAARGELPWLAALVRGNDVVCGATLLSATHLVTAAHCVDGIDAASLSVLVGEYELEGSLGRARRVATVAQHPDFDAHSFDNDIAVLRLESPLPDQMALPACLPASTTIMGTLEGRHAMVSGWGKTSEGGVTSNLPRKVSVKVWSEAECKSAGYGARKITPRMLCAGLAEGGRDACRGDSGGPLVTAGANGELVLIGIVSWGRGCARPLYPGVYTRVDRALPWLRTQLRDSPCTPPGSSLRSFIANIFRF